MGGQRDTLDERKRLEEIYGHIKDFASDTVPLGDDDYRLFGRFIQVFCVADFSARRVVEGMRNIMSLPEIDIGKLSDKDVIGHLIRCGREWPGAANIGEGVVKAGVTLEMHHSVRHSLAHWAARRIRGYDAYFFLTASDNHKPPPGGHRIETPDVGANASFRLFPAAELRDELTKLEGHAQWLSELNDYLRTNADALKGSFADG